MKRHLTFICRQKITSSFTFYLRYCKDIANLHYQLVETFWVYLQTKNQIHLSFFWRNCKDVQTSYFRYFGHVWLCTPIMVVSTRGKLLCSSAGQKYTSSITSFLRYYILKNAATWLAKSTLNHNLRARILPDMGLIAKYQ